MDSLTQIVLGAAVGELTMGKKVGNRALLWGAVGGTIPDLDVLAGAFLSPLGELAAHRGFSHSIVFAILGAFIFGWLIHFIYRSSYHRYIAFVGWFLIPVGVVYFISRIFDNATFSPVSAIGLGAILLFALWALYRRYFVKGVAPPEATLGDWRWLMFWAIFTHPLLDCFTTYGTQLFQPFSDYRVALNTVAVADPLYTVPFLLCLVIASRYRRSNKIRRTLAWMGIAISSAYLVLCLYNKSRVNNVWERTLKEEGIEYSRFMTSPSILNNVLWSCLAETDDGYVHGEYSLFDKEKKVHFSYTARNPIGAEVLLKDRTIECLKWFSNGYYTLSEHEEGLQFNDMRFGSLPLDGGDTHYIFNFIVRPRNDGSYELLGSNGGPPPGQEQEMLKVLWERLKGV